MINCPTCKYYANDKCNRSVRTMGLSICPYAEERKPRNHFEMLKAMSVEEMAEFLEEEITRNPHCNLEKHCTNDDSCIPCWLEWLKEEIIDDSKTDPCQRARH